MLFTGSSWLSLGCLLLHGEVKVTCLCGRDDCPSCNFLNLPIDSVRCPCGYPILADTEDWKVPRCYQCWHEMGEPKEEPSDD